MTHGKFDPAKLDKLNNPARFVRMEPPRIWAAAGIANPGVIVEIGAGTGIFAAAFANFAPKATVYAVDTEPLMIGWMKAHRAPASRRPTHARSLRPRQGAAPRRQSRHRFP